MVINQMALVILRRSAFNTLQKLTLEKTSYCLRFPGYLQDRAYLQILNRDIQAWTEILNSADLDLDQQPAQLIQGPTKL